DQLVPLGPSRAGLEAIRGEATEVITYPGARHEIFNETNRGQVLADVVASPAGCSAPGPESGGRQPPRNDAVRTLVHSPSACAARRPRSEEHCARLTAPPPLGAVRPVLPARPEHVLLGDADPGGP